MSRDDGAAGVDGDGVGAVPPTDLDVAADQARWHRVAVAPQRHERVGGDGAHHSQLGRIRRSGQGKQRLCRSELGDRDRPRGLDRRHPDATRVVDIASDGRTGARFRGRRRVRTSSLVGDVDTPAVQRRLRFGRGGDLGGAPPRLGEVVDRLLHHAFAVAVAWRARIHGDAVVLGHRGERTLHLIGAGLDHRGHPIDPPALRRPTEPDQHLVDGDDQMTLIVGLGEPAATAIRMGQGADEHERLAAPRRVIELQPVPLDLLTRRVVDVHMSPPVRRGARFTMRAQLAVAQLAGERRIRLGVAERHHLGEQHRRPHVHVVAQPLTDIGLEPGEHVRPSLRPHARFPPARQVGADRLAVPAGVAGDSRDRPAPLAQRCDLHVFLCCQHRDGAPLADWSWSRDHQP
jgi:hypothetical protein